MWVEFEHIETERNRIQYLKCGLETKDLEFSQKTVDSTKKNKI